MTINVTDVDERRAKDRYEVTVSVSDGNGGADSIE